MQHKAMKKTHTIYNYNKRFGVINVLDADKCLYTSALFGNSK